MNMTCEDFPISFFISSALKTFCPGTDEFFLILTIGYSNNNIISIRI